ncbi:hypothetical protein MSG37_16660 [Shewanella sp. 1CM18E]|uniref:hypothetical protein n=1 Tax=Shewanella sp. 1CM18E TaxID=2929169 RepID=UPI0020C0B544|nr:hypothetical protein [Shewanella sp. 1CM18E]MCK8046520.1 hypothetical protein [Shewanella sp. 1CM18E]
MRKSKVMMLTLLIVSNLFWFLNYFHTKVDHAVTLTYHNASYETITKMLEQALIVANKNLIGEPLATAENTLVEDVYGLKPFKKEGCLYAGGLCLKLDETETVISVSMESL